MTIFNKDIPKAIRGIFGWSVVDGEVIPPKYEFPPAMKYRVEYFRDLFEDGATFMSVMEWIFAYDEEECKEDYESIFIGSWLPLDEESKKWIETAGSMGQMIVAVALIYGVYGSDSEESGSVEEICKD